MVGMIIPGKVAMIADKTVLIVDDSVIVRKISAMALRRRGYGIIEASNGREAVERYREHRPDVILLDLIMPKLGGLPALKQIISSDPSARVIIVTHGSETEVREALQAGARGFVLKPFNHGHIVEAVEAILATTDAQTIPMNGYSQPPREYQKLAS